MPTFKAYGLNALGYLRMLGLFGTAVGLLAALTCSRLEAQARPCDQAVPRQMLCDEFSDGDAQDDTPASWIPSSRSQDATIAVNMEHLSLSSIVIVENLPLMEDTSIRTRITLPTNVERDNVFIGVQARRNDVTNDGYSAALWPTQGAALIARETGGTILSQEPVALDVTQEDVMFQFDAIGETLSLWAWKPDDPMPVEPLVTAIDTTHAEGVISLFVSNLDGSDPEGIFRFVQVAEESIPATPIPGDFDANGVLDANDIDLLVKEFGGDTASFDLNGDRIVNGEDHRIWVKEKRKTWYGDVNLDGEFNSGDLTEVFRASQYEDAVDGNSTWLTGDWNGDGDFTTGDLTLAFQDGGYEMGPRAATSAVPEPTAFAMLAIGLLSLSIRRRSK